MLSKNKIKKILTSNYYEVANTIKLKIGDSQYSSTASFEVLLKKLHSLQYDIFLNVRNFKINNKTVENKFSLLSHEYLNCLYPLRFNILGNKLVVINYIEIKNRIIQKDKEMKSFYSGEGLEHIRKEFLSHVDTREKVEQFVMDLPIVKMIDLSLHRFTENLDYDLSWFVAPLGSIDFKVHALQEGNKVTYKATNNDKESFINQLHQYDEEQGIKPISDYSDSLYQATYNYEVAYEEKELGFTNSQTTIVTSLGEYFDYNQTITLRSKV
jgi:hypothetical protein